jgi:hypothetical protein
MNWDMKLNSFPKPIKSLISAFILVMLFGYGASFVLLSDTSGFEPGGIEQNYNGNENSDAEGPLKFRKSKHEMMNIVHTHAFTLSVIFFIMSGFVYFTHLQEGIKKFFMVEPMLSIITTFGSIILLWKGMYGFKYIALISGVIMHVSFIAMLIIVIWELYFTKRPIT